MFTGQINDLLARQLDIQEEILNLSKESSELSRQICILNNSVPKSTSEIKSEIKDTLKSKGFKIQTKKQFGSDTMIISNHTKSFTVLLKLSKYHDEPNYQSWFTLNPEVENFVDVFIFNYLDNQGISNCIIIDNEKMNEILNTKEKLKDGRAHVHFNIKRFPQIIETNSRMDLSSFKNNYDLFN